MLPAEYKLHRVLITVMTYPHPSITSDEVVCTAGITEDGEWVRLYPVSYRNCEPHQKFRKFQWIEVGLADKGGRNDIRPESRKPFTPSIRLLGEPIGTGDQWRERREIIDRLPHHTVRQLQQSYEHDKTSLGVVKPSRILDIKVSSAERDWKPEWQAIYDQVQLFGGETPRKLEKLPYKWSYIFECKDNAQPHSAMIEDWELGVLFLKLKESYGEEKAASMVREKYLNELAAESRDTRFFMGTTWPHNAWVVIGVFWPPSVNQLELGL